MSHNGGNDLLEKPFLTSEITVKALTFALRGRLQQLERSRFVNAVIGHVGKPYEIKPSPREFEALLAHEEKVNT